MPTGTVVQVSEHVAGSDLIDAPRADAVEEESGSIILLESGSRLLLEASGIDELDVTDLTDFDADGGYVTLVDSSGNSETVAYVMSDEGLNLLSALSGTYAQGDMVYMTDSAGNRIVERWADIQEPQGEETIRCRVPHALVPLLPMGIRSDEDGEQVSFGEDGTDAVITDVLGKQPKGIELPAAPTAGTHPDDEDTVRWIRRSDGRKIGAIFGQADPVLPQTAVQAWAYELDMPALAGLFAFNIAGFGAGIEGVVHTGAGAASQYLFLTVPDDAGGLVTKWLLRGDGTSDYELDVSAGWQNWTPTFSGWSANPASGVYRYKQTGKTVHLAITMPNTGTSNATTKTLSLPVTARSANPNAVWSAPCAYTDNGTAATTSGRGIIAASGTTIGFFTNWAVGAFTNSGAASIRECHITYEAA